ncbi:MULTISPECIES: DUF488 domain-containing protein [unclassified Melioribacter]|uniref:DUF488 domain-containing protein n=1 Tax=unclassified Melioribacter TaxID=2627329 RepID=UPI003BBC1D82
MTIKVKRVYEKPEKEDGYRILVDRLWPRGISKDEAKINMWLKEIAPSDELRKWFSHDPAKWNSFREKYKRELEGKKEIMKQIKALEKENGIVTLLYSAKDEKHNNAIVLKNIINSL